MRVRILYVEMRRFLAILVFAVAAGAATAAGAGVAVAQHADSPGTPLFHDHVFAAYRLEVLVSDLDSSLVLALLALLWPRLPRPTLLAVADVPSAALVRAGWRAAHLTGPPRQALHAV